MTPLEKHSALLAEVRALRHGYFVDHARRACQLIDAWKIGYSHAMPDLKEADYQMCLKAWRETFAELQRLDA